jgi:hypothetical protein
MTELHVIPDERTNDWRVYAASASAPLSEHADARDAELAAQARAERAGIDRVVVHDRYHRVHEAAPLPAALRARTRFVRDRELALVRERIRQPPGTARTRPI